MSDIEIEAFNYYTIINSGVILDSSLWIRYITLSNELTNKNVEKKKCSRRLKQAHTYLSDYFKLKK